MAQNENECFILLSFQISHTTFYIFVLRISSIDTFVLKFANFICGDFKEIIPRRVTNLFLKVVIVYFGSVFVCQDSKSYILVY